MKKDGYEPEKVTSFVTYLIIRLDDMLYGFLDERSKTSRPTQVHFFGHTIVLRQNWKKK